MGAREHRQADRVGVLLQRGLGHLLGGLVQAGVDDLEPGVAQRPGDDLDPPVVAVEPGLGDDDSIGAQHARDTKGMPVAPRRQRNPRTLVLGVAGLVLGLVLLIVVFVVAVPSLTESGKVKVKLGSDTFDAGSTTKRAESIRRDGPLLFSDPAGGRHDIYLQHLGDDDATGWSAFEARKTGTSRDCTLQWNRRRGSSTTRATAPPSPRTAPVWCSTRWRSPKAAR